MIKVILASPEKEIFNGEAKKIIVRTDDGEISILRGHEPLISTVSSGEVVIEKIGEERNIFTAFNGVINVQNKKGETTVSVLVESTEDVSLLDKKIIEEALEEAKKANAEKGDEELLIDTGMLREMNRLRLAKKYRM